MLVEVLVGVLVGVAVGVLVGVSVEVAVGVFVGISPGRRARIWATPVSESFDAVAVFVPVGPAVA